MEDCPGGNIIMMAKGYWRRNNKTDRIE